MIKMSPAVAGFLKGILGVVVIAIVSYFGDASHLSGIVNLGTATIVAGFFSSLESYLKSQSGNTTALFGTAKIV